MTISNRKLGKSTCFIKYGTHEICQAKPGPILDLRGDLLTLNFWYIPNLGAMVSDDWLDLDHVAVIGNTGAGKSALCNLLTGQSSFYFN